MGTDRSVTGWDKAARQVRGLMKASHGFRTLRDMVPAGCVVEGSQLEPQWPLGEGAYAYVCLARLDGHREVAVKTLKPHLLGNPKELSMFFSETQLLRRLRHANIVEFIGVGGDEAEASGQLGRLYIVQEYCAGGSLRDLVLAQMFRPDDRLYTHADALRWAVQLSRALTYLHSARPKVIHRDLKLDNVLRTHKPAATSDVKLCDFGLARLVAASSGGLHLKEEL